MHKQVRLRNYGQTLRRVIIKLFSIRSRRVKRRLIKLWAIAAYGVILAVVMTYQKPVDNLNYSGLLTTIAKGESNGNYNAYYGKPDNTKLKLTSMTIDEVLAWQKKFVEKGSPSSAAGKYQIIRTTLEGLVAELKIDRRVRYDEAMQDRLAIALLERRGVKDYARGKISREQFAHNLSQEWAALPKTIGDKPEESYYAGDGLNKVRVSQKEVFSSIDTLNNRQD